MSDRIGILRDGRLIREGTPREVYFNPGDSFTARFLGEANLLQGQPEASGLRLADGTLLAGVSQPVLALRPEVIAVSAMPPEGGPALRGRLKEKVFTGASVTCLVEGPGGAPVKAIGTDADTAALHPGDEVWLTWPADRAISLPN